jgi:hypothetical protein
MNRRAAKFLIVGGILAFGVLGGLFIGHSPAEEPGINNVNTSFTLAAPAFAQGVPSDQFPMNEAGISAYVNANQGIDLGKARTLFKGVEADTGSYVVGTVELPGHTEEMWPHVWIDKSGWILAYYPKTEPMSRIMQWYGYQRDVITTTTLRDTVMQICQKLGINLPTFDADMHYYHFQHPEATKILIAVDTASGSDTFKFTIPYGITLYNAAWSHYGASISGYGCWSESKMDGARLYRAGAGTYIGCDTVEPQYQTPGTAHTVYIGCAGGWAGIAIMFIYR